MQTPKFPFLMPVWTNIVGVLRPDQSDGQPAPWVVCAIRLKSDYNQDTDESSWGGFEYLLGNLSDDFYGWVSEDQLVKAEYPVPADDTSPLEEHPDLDDVRNMPATSMG